MSIKAIFREGKFWPLSNIKSINEGQTVEINIEFSDEIKFNNRVMQGKSFDFLKNEENLYSEKDLI